MRLKPYNIGSCWKGLQLSFHVVPSCSTSFHFWVSFITFCNCLKILMVTSVTKLPQKHCRNIPTDTTIHWKDLEEHFLMVPLVFRFDHFHQRLCPGLLDVTSLLKYWWVQDVMIYTGGSTVVYSNVLIHLA
jgi:hypothetical protein